MTWVSVCLQMLAAPGGGEAYLNDLPIAITDVAYAPEPPESGGNTGSSDAQLFLQVTRHV